VAATGRAHPQPLLRRRDARLRQRGEAVTISKATTVGRRLGLPKHPTANENLR
jgi:hypothetical protein